MRHKLFGLALAVLLLACSKDHGLGVVRPDAAGDAAGTSDHADASATATRDTKVLPHGDDGAALALDSQTDSPTAIWPDAQLLAADTQPTSGGRDAQPAPGGADAQPAQNGTDAQPTPASVDAQHVQNSADAQPTPGGADVQPAQNDTDAQPTPGRVDAQPAQNGADAQTTSGWVDAQPADATRDSLDPGIASIAGSWTGYIENHKFSSGSDIIRFVLAVDSAGQISGHVTYGEGTPPPPATDPNVNYPPNADLSSGPPMDYEGFPYSIVTASYASLRLRFSVDADELWSGWCALQPAPTDGSTTCLPQFTSITIGPSPNCSMTQLDGETVAVDCGRLTLCGRRMGQGVCTCSPAGCVSGSPSDPTASYTSFDVFVVGATASGSVSGALSGNVHFIKDP